MARILIKAAFDSSSGYGNDGCGLARVLDQMGHDVVLCPVSIAPPVPTEVAMLLTKDLSPPFDVSIVHVDPLAMKVEEGLRRTSKKTVAWTMWEYSRFDARGKSRLKKAFRSFDLFLSYDEITKQALDPFIAAKTENKILQGGFWSEDWPYIERDWTTPFRFIMVGQLHARKDPFAAIKAFNLLKGRHGAGFDAELHLKTNVLGLHPSMSEAYEGLRIFYAWWTVDQLRSFYSRAHCLLAPSRGEGKNIPALEAQSTGMPVIATDYGGHREWLRSEYAYPIPFHPFEYPQGPAAKVDVEELAEIMWHVYSNRDEAREKGRIASQTIPAICDWSKVAVRLLDMVGEIPEREIAMELG